LPKPSSHQLAEPVKVWVAGDGAPPDLAENYAEK